MFIAFEGMDGSGKTTQINLLYKYLSQRFTCLLTDEPTKGPMGTLIRKLLKEEKVFDALAMQLLFSADRAYHVRKEIIPALENGKVVLTGRYTFSTIAYGAASGIDKRLLMKANSQFPVPDLTFVIDNDPKLAITRISARNAQFLQQRPLISYTMPEYDKTQIQRSEVFEQLEFLTKVAKEYRELARKYKNCFLIDGSKSIEDVNREIIKIVNKLI